MKHWYESCLGGLFSTDEELTCEEMYCDICGDGSTYIGMYNTEDEAYRGMKELFGYG